MPAQDLITMASMGGAQHSAADAYLLCIVEGASWTVPLPAAGELDIGRDETCALAIADPLISRRHALITVFPDVVRLADLESRHGTTVNGEKLAGPRALVAGDVIGLGNAVIVVQRVARPVASRSLIEPLELRRRLEVELERALRFERELAVAAIAGHERDRARLAIALSAKLRLTDAAALDGDELLVLLSERDEDEAAEVAAELLALGAHARIGLALSPRDGCDADSLLAAARSALASAAPGAVAAARTDVGTLDIGGKTIAIADPAMRRLYELIRRLARSDLPILVHGETGAGKEIAATAIHHLSKRAGGPLVSINCAALPEQLVESELFGHEKGAFTGALAAKAGLFESAHGGTVFLDEIGELSAATQAKLLRVLEMQRITRVGDVREREIDIRLVAATNRDLAAEVSAGRFRQDLLFRLNAARVVVPPLRDRRRELAVLAEQLLAAACTRMERRRLRLSVAALQALHLHDWPGNVRELRNAMDLAAASAPDHETEVAPWHLPHEVTRTARTARDGVAPEPLAVTPRFRPIGDEVRELERARMIAALSAVDGQQNRAAELIAMPLRTFVTKLKRYGITAADWALKT